MNNIRSTLSTDYDPGLCTKKQ